jgi:hypothetical protein
MSINERIAELIKVLEDSENSFAKRIGVSSSVVFNVVNPKGRKSYPSGPVLEKMLAIKKSGNSISAEWLMRGEGEMFLTGQHVSGVDMTDINKTIELLNDTVAKLNEDFEQIKKGRV